MVGVDLLGQQAEVVGVADELVEALLRAVDLARLGQAETSQNEQITNVPSSPSRPSAFRPSSLR